MESQGSGLLVTEVDDDEVTRIREAVPVLANGRITEEPAAEVAQ